MTASDSVVTECFQLAKLSFNGFIVSCYTYGSEVVMIGNTCEEHFLAVEFESELRTVFDGAQTYLVADGVDDLSVFLHGGFYSI